MSGTDEPQVKRPFARRVARALVGAALGLVALCLVGWLALRFRPLPAPTSRELFRGIRYTREIQRAPRLAIVHVVTVTIGTPGLRFLVTPGDPAKQDPFVGSTTSGFLRAHHAQVAVNGDFFEPWWSRGPFDYYPHQGDPVRVMGPAASGGVVYGRGRGGARQGTLRISYDDRPSFSLPLSQAREAVSGEVLVVEGEIKALGRHAGGPEPRTAVGLDRGESRLYLVVVDGRQPHYSEGLTTVELAETLVKLGAFQAINLDGGGSSALVMEDGSGGATTLSSPIHTRIPGRERPVANHLGIFAPRLP
jgi:hypothetical protein